MGHINPSTHSMHAILRVKLSYETYFPYSNIYEYSLILPSTQPMQPPLCWTRLSADIAVALSLFSFFFFPAKTPNNCLSSSRTNTLRTQQYCSKLKWNHQPLFPLLAGCYNSPPQTEPSANHDRDAVILISHGSNHPFIVAIVNKKEL